MYEHSNNNISFTAHFVREEDEEQGDAADEQKVSMQTFLRMCSDSNHRREIRIIV